MKHQKISKVYAIQFHKELSREPCSKPLFCRLVLAKTACSAPLFCCPLQVTPAPSERRCRSSAMAIPTAAAKMPRRDWKQPQQAPKWSTKWTLRRRDQLKKTVLSMTGNWPWVMGGNWQGVAVGHFNDCSED